MLEFECCHVADVERGDLNGPIRFTNQNELGRRHKTSVPDQQDTIKVHLINVFRDHGQREFEQGPSTVLLRGTLGAKL